MTVRRVGRIAVLAYGLAASFLGLATVAYAAAFLANAVPKSVDAGVTHSVGDPLVVDLILVGLFALQHSLMARPAFKARWTRVVPAAVERSTYVLFAGAALAVLMYGWRPLPRVVWRADGALEPALWAVSLGGWLLVVAGVFAIDGHRLLGLRQSWAAYRGRDLAPLDFQTPGLYRHVRHPIMTGFLVAFWATPRMTLGHLVFAAGTTAYVLVGVSLEERDLVAAFGDRYVAYRRTVPAFAPRPWRSVGSRLRDSGRR